MHITAFDRFTNAMANVQVCKKQFYLCLNTIVTEVMGSVKNYDRIAVYYENMPFIFDIVIFDDEENNIQLTVDYITEESHYCLADIVYDCEQAAFEKAFGLDLVQSGINKIIVLVKMGMIRNPNCEWNK